MYGGKNMDLGSIKLPLYLCCNLELLKIRFFICNLGEMTLTFQSFFEEEMR